MADDRRVALQGASARNRSGWRKPSNGTHKRGLNSKIHLAVDAHGMPVRIIVTEGTRADCKLALALIEGILAEFLFADKGYDTNEIIEYARKMGIELVIPPKKNRIKQRDYDKFLYKYRHLVENAFLKLKRWRGVATRYAKTLSPFIRAVNLAAIVLWLRCVARFV